MNKNTVSHEYESADQILQRHSRFVNLVSKISSDLVMIGGECSGVCSGECSGECSGVLKSECDNHCLDLAITGALSEIGEFAGADRAFVFRYDPRTAKTFITHQWCCSDVEPRNELFREFSFDEQLPWFSDQIRVFDVVNLSDTAKLPSSALSDKDHFNAQNIKSILAVPIKSRGNFTGFLGFDSIRKCRTWKKDDQSLLHFLSLTMSNHFEREIAEKALNEAVIILNRSKAVAWTWKNQPGWPVEFVTENVERLFGYSARDFISGTVQYANCIHKDDLERVFNEVSDFSNTTGTMEFNHSPYRIVTKTGNIKIVSDWTFIERDLNGNITHYKGIIEDITKRRRAEEALQRETRKLEKALKKIKTLSGMLPICSSCKKIRDDKGYWNQIETYIRRHSEAEFSHSICPECITKLYPDLDLELFSDK